MKNFILGFTLCLLLVIGLLVRLLWPSELSLVFDGFFLVSLALFSLCIIVIVLLYRKTIGHTRHSKLLFSLLLIVFAAILYDGFADIGKKTQEWKPLLEDDYDGLFIVLEMFISNVRNIISFGLAAIGASYAANVIYDNGDIAKLE